jgi:hypothetical protein
MLNECVTRKHSCNCLGLRHFLNKSFRCMRSNVFGKSTHDLWDSDSMTEISVKHTAADPWLMWWKKKLISGALIRKRTIPTELPPLVGEVSANCLQVEGVAWPAQWIPTAVNLGFLYRSRYFFIQIAPQLSSRGWVDTVPEPPTSLKMC